METPLPVVNGRYIKNRTKSGKVSLHKLQHAVNYISYGHEFENPQRYLRGQWRSQDGETTPADVLEWAGKKGQLMKYAYTFILSLRDGLMADDDFTAPVSKLAQAEDSSFPDDWRLMVHRDSDHDHAHLVLFRDRTLSKAELAQWRQQLQQDLAMREQQRLTQQLAAENQFTLDL